MAVEIHSSTDGSTSENRARSAMGLAARITDAMGRGLMPDYRRAGAAPMVACRRKPRDDGSRFLYSRRANASSDRFENRHRQADVPTHRKEMSCFPSCEVPLPRIGHASVYTEVDVCKDPAILTLRITSDGRRSTSTFVAGNAQEVTRIIGNDYWPLHLRVRFQNAADFTGHHVKACLDTPATGNSTCFMDMSTGFPLLLLCVILATCLLMVGVAIVTVVHRFYGSQKSPESRKPSRTTTTTDNDTGDVRYNECHRYPLLFEPQFIQKYPLYDDRLAVIAEVDEKDHISITSSSGVESGHTKSVNEDRGSQKSPDSRKDNNTLKVDCRTGPVLPHSLTEKRRKSQPMLFPASPSPSLESFKPRSLSATTNATTTVTISTNGERLRPGGVPATVSCHPSAQKPQVTVLPTFAPAQPVV
ncbi:hypothetical protein AAVH_13504 [Aphelenchoides avenae]|nr:hypothetical protein AAVH_13504 [Aphelenchus avenae]